MIGIEVLIPSGLKVPTPEGDVIFPPGEWVKFKPKWSLWPLEKVADNAKNLGIVIKDQNEDIHDMAKLSEDEATALVRKFLSYMHRFVL